jgi:hypothetical protein
VRPLLQQAAGTKDDGEDDEDITPDAVVDRLPDIGDVGHGSIGVGAHGLLVYHDERAHCGHSRNADKRDGADLTE